MDYELLKIGKVLPILNNPTAHELKQEINKKSHRPELKPKSPKAQLRTLITKQGGVPRPKKELKVSQAKSFDGFPHEKFTAVLEEYKTIETHLKKKNNPLKVLENLFERSPKRTNTMRMPMHMRFTSTEASFYKKSPNESSNSPSNHAITSGNFVFPKKQVLLRDSNQLDYVYQYSLGTGFTVLTDDSLGLNGKKVSLGEIKQKQVIRQQKKYLKDWKVDPMNTFHSPYRELEEISKNVKGLVSPQQSSQLPNPRTGHRAKTLTVNVGLKTTILDRSHPHTFDRIPQTQTWNFDSPLKLKSAF